MRTESKIYGSIALVFLIIGIGCSAAGIARFDSNMEDVFQWLPDTSSARVTYDQFVARFGSDDFVVLTWPGCTLSDPRTDQVALRLTNGPARKFVQDAVSGPQLLRSLEEYGLDRETVLERFRGVYFGPDHSRTCIVVSLNAAGMAHRKESTAAIRETAKKILKDDGDRLLMGGYPQVGAHGDQIIRESILTLVIPSCLLSTLAAWLCLRSVRLVMGVLAVSGLAAAMSVAVVTLSGSKWGGLSSVIPSLAYILTVSGSLHLVNYARTFAQPTARAILGCGWKPCFFSAITTTAGMLSLCRSSFLAVREFGVYCAAGVVVSLLSQLILMPILIESLHNAESHRPRSTWLQDAILGQVLRWRTAVIFSSFATVALLFIGFAQLEGELEVERVFTPRSRVIREIGELERNLGPIEQTELIVNFHGADGRQMYRHLRVIRSIEAEIRAISGVFTTLSLATSLPDEPTEGGLNATIRRTLIRRRLREAREALADTPYLYVGDDVEAWRISIRVPLLEKTDFGGLAERAMQAAETAVQREAATNDPDYEATNDISLQFTGVSHLYHVAQESVISDLLMNCAAAFLLICPLMIVAVGSFRLGLLAMIPNVFPMVAVYGAIGLLQYPLDIGMTMTASVALGIAVDDTTHFLLRFRDLQRSASSSFVALRTAYRQCSSAMFQTTLIAGVGLFVFVTSPLAAMTRFIFTLIALLVVALLCDLTMLPGLVSCHERISRDEDGDE
jgi:predicted RND superfamily exporter protein